MIGQQDDLFGQGRTRSWPGRDRAGQCIDSCIRSSFSHRVSLSKQTLLQCCCSLQSLCGSQSVSTVASCVRAKRASHAAFLHPPVHAFASGSRMCKVSRRAIDGCTVIPPIFALFDHVDAIGFVTGKLPTPKRHRCFMCSAVAIGRYSCGYLA